MNGITYFKLQSPYDGDVTKNCALTGSEVDNNFYTLEGRDIKSVELVDDKITINLMNGDKLTTDKLTEDCVKDLNICFDEVNGILTITHNGVTQTINGFATNYNVAQAISVDGSVIGNGLSESPVGISPVQKTGQYRPVRCIIDTMNNERLPSRHCALPGDRYLTIENVNDYGYLYNYNGLKKIACKLRESGSEWRIPTKQDWDDMLNAIEPCDDVRNHADARSNKLLGKFAGKFLKSRDRWMRESLDPCCEDETCFDYTDMTCDDECACGRHIQCHPDYCGEYGHCRHKHKQNNNGIDKYGFRILPAGYATEAKDYLYFTERAYFWTASNHEYRDAYIKSFAYNKSNVLQDILASDNYLSVRLVKDFNGDNYKDCEEILGSGYSTVLMPSMLHGKAIWTAVNISVAECGCDCHCNDYVLPNNGEGMEYVKKYFINEWNGKEWLKKELVDGDSVVVINETVTTQGTNSDNTCDCHENKTYDAKYNEYRLMNGELVNVTQAICDTVIETIQTELDGMNGDINDLRQRLEDEITRSTTKDAEIEEAISGIQQRLTTAEENIQANTEAIQGLDEKIEQEKAEREAAIAAEEEARIAKDEELEAKDAELEAAIQAEAEARAAKDTEIEEAIQAEQEARIAKDEELEAAIAAETEARVAKDEELEAKDAELEAAIQQVHDETEAAIQAEAEARAAKDEELEEAITAEEEARIAKDEELEGQLLTQEGTEFDAENGVLTLKSKNSTNDIQIQFNMNFGTF